MFSTTEQLSQNAAGKASYAASDVYNTHDIATNTTNINNLSDSITTLTDDALLWDAASGTFCSYQQLRATTTTNVSAFALAAARTKTRNRSQVVSTQENGLTTTPD
ncbi:hypothetical protein, partial [Salmonella enterica]|uniref:hypothetical protein n=1 Tax=Salmonella enterica TaxID=28901 RepID=UPI00398C4ACE